MKIHGLRSAQATIEVIRGRKDKVARLVCHIKDCESATPYTRRNGKDSWNKDKAFYKVLLFTEAGTVETWVNVNRVESIKL